MGDGLAHKGGRPLKPRAQRPKPRIAAATWSAPRLRTLIKLVRFLFVCAVLLAMIGGGFAGLTIWYFGRDLPDYQQLANYQPPLTTRVLAGDGRLLAEYATERRVFVPISVIPKRGIAAFLAAEDKNFHSHHGVDP